MTDPAPAQPDRGPFAGRLPSRGATGRALEGGSADQPPGARLPGASRASPLTSRCTAGVRRNRRCLNGIPDPAAECVESPARLRSQPPAAAARGRIHRAANRGRWCGASSASRRPVEPGTVQLPRFALRVLSAGLPLAGGESRASGVPLTKRPPPDAPKPRVFESPVRPLAVACPVPGVIGLGWIERSIGGRWRSSAERRSQRIRQPEDIDDRQAPTVNPKGQQVAGSFEEMKMRKYIDCREWPSEKKCSLSMSADNEEELMTAAVQHATTVHGHKDTTDFRKQLRGMFRASPTKA